MGEVVDDKLKVKGANGLRVIDASVFPGHVSGNIMSTVRTISLGVFGLPLNAGVCLGRVSLTSSRRTLWQKRAPIWSKMTMEGTLREPILGTPKEAAFSTNTDCILMGINILSEIDCRNSQAPHHISVHCLA